MFIVFPIIIAITGLLLGSVLNRFALHWTDRPVLASPLMGLATALLFGLAAFQLGMQKELAAALFFISILIIVVQTDLSELIIPNKVVLIGVAGAILLRLWSHPLPLWNYGIAAIAGSGFLLLIGIAGGKLLKKEAMGGGDIKLYVFIGLVLGIKLTLLSIFLASAAALAIGILQLMLRVYQNGRTIPFGPYIAVGAITAYFWGDRFIEAYLSLLSQGVGNG
ncbi:prepilin peptidase [Paenibacillus abyssi]|uniref:Prepilin type IV endopeptidase peptidase domain-containing protein n=1 Tax=Paenibacillus abyssi TaxID=1340531 RepID=A0A917LGW1_9BACL|nr:A24 family peptidase [Paenibacillus abyssi]GGG23510.1 hypothetical protein GCM10010916_45100 [Paenibacillus abyssi]